MQFPLAESGDLERELGSRHRAALGLSQESDAVVVVVSEETGDISIAENAQLYRKLTPEQLRAMLLDLLAAHLTDAAARRHKPADQADKQIAGPAAGDLKPRQSEERASA